jgi:hypothetical protein
LLSFTLLVLHAGYTQLGDFENYASIVEQELSEVAAQVGVDTISIWSTVTCSVL